jgi:hypothetical protein
LRSRGFGWARSLLSQLGSKAPPYATIDGA